MAPRAPKKNDPAEPDVAGSAADKPKRAASKSAGAKTTAAKTTAAKTTRKRTLGPLSEPASHSVEEIARRAYEIAMSGHGGDDLENWLRAEQELRSHAA
jgi:hypothetical protein